MAPQTRFAISRGDWRVSYDPVSSTLDCVHELSSARVVAKLSFETEREDGTQAWSVGLPRDSGLERLALVDPEGNVQGYVAFTGAAGTLGIHPVHRAAQAYRGVLHLTGTAQLGARTFACRTQPLAAKRVVQMASGPADSALNDSLLDVATDRALRLKGKTVSITTLATENGVAPTFDIHMTACPHEPAAATQALELITDYYGGTYVPSYRPIDKERCPSPPTGWMSWNVYFDTAGEEENLAEARVAASKLKPFGLEIWSIESWQDNSDKLPVSTFHNLTLRPHPGQFPHGMKWLAEQIRALGFRPGIWTVPFGTGDDAFYEAHRDWFLHHPDGKPMSNWCGRYVLDPSQPAVRQHMEETHRTMSQEWGYEFFKIDGMSGRGPSYSAHFFQREEVRAAFKEPCDDPLALCLEALRHGIGPDRLLLLGQGHYTGPDVAYADAARIGGDVVAPNQPIRWHNVLSQAQATLNQLFLHNIVWYSDPDTLLVGKASSLDVARLSTTVVGLPGQLMFAGDKLAELPARRMRLLQQCLPVCDVRPLDLFPVFELTPIWDLKIRRPFGSWNVVSLFNWGDKDANTGFRFGELGLDDEADYLLYDFWNEAFIGDFRGEFLAVLPPRANLLLAIHPVLGRPQFLSTDRHITQGGMSLEAVDWDDRAGILSGVVRLVERVPTTMVFFKPLSYRLESASADDAAVLDTSSDPDGVVWLTLERATSGSASFRLAFSREEG